MQANVKRISPLMTVQEVMERTALGYEASNRICRLYGIRAGCNPKSQLYIHRETLETYLRAPWELEEKAASRHVAKKRRF